MGSDAKRENRTNIYSKDENPRFSEFVHDAEQFVLFSEEAVKAYPLQVYLAHLFLPTSLVKTTFRSDALSRMQTSLATEISWNVLQLEGHTDRVQEIAFSHDSTLLASASDDNTVRIWGTETGECLQTLKGHTNWVRNVAFSHDSTLLASTSRDKTVRIWDAKTGECLQTLEHHSNLTYILSATFSHDSKLLASGCADRLAQIWDTQTGKRLQTLKDHTNWVRNVAFSHDSTLLASASDDTTVRVWDAKTGECLHTLNGHNSYVNLVAFSHDSMLLASASHDEMVRIWDTRSRRCLRMFKAGALGYLSFDSISSTLVTSRGTIALDAPPDSSVMRDESEAQDVQFRGVGLSEDGSWIVYNSQRWILIPHKYMVYSSAVSGNTIGAGSYFGEAWICTVKNSLSENS